VDRLCKRNGDTRSKVSKLEFRKLSTSEHDKKVWDNFVSSSSNGTIFHTALWLDIWGGEFDIWGIFKGEQLVAGFVAPYKRAMGVKIVWQPPLTPYSGLVFRRYECKYVTELTDKKEIATELIAFLRTQYRWGILSFDPLVTDMQPFIWNGFKVNVHYTYILDLTDMQKRWEEMSKDAKYEIRKASADGLVVVEATSFDQVLDLVIKTYQRQKLQFRYVELFRRYYEVLTKNDQCRGLLCLNREGNRIAASFIVWDAKKAYDLLGGYDEKNKHSGAMRLCDWEGINYISNTPGCKEFDFEGSMIPRIEKPFREFGGKLTPYYQISWGKGIESIFNIRLLLNRVTGL
jgi:hypothetical protein